jgi:hypothetical protein
MRKVGINTSRRLHDKINSFDMWYFIRFNTATIRKYMDKLNKAKEKNI